MSAGRGGGAVPGGAVAALIPAYREAARIAPVIRGVRKHVGAVLVVDDGSEDDTAAVAREAGAEVVRHEINRGKGAAIKTGLNLLAQRGFDWIVLLDGDGQHSPEDVPALLAARHPGRPPLVLGNRMGDTATMPAVRRMVNRAMSAAIGGLCGQHIPDTQCGFRLVAAEVVPLLQCPSDRFDYESEMLFALSRAGHRIRSVPVQTLYGGEKSKIHPVRDTVRFLRLLWRHRSGPG